MKFLADENIERPIVDALRAAGHDVLSVSEGPRGLPDEEVLYLAQAERRILLTNDKDFGELVFRLRQSANGIVLLRLGTEDGEEKAARLTEILPHIEARLAGHFAVVTEGGVRLRPLGLSDEETGSGHAQY